MDQDCKHLFKQGKDQEQEIWPNQGNDQKTKNNQEQDDQKQEDDEKQNRPIALQNINIDSNEGYKPFDNGYDSPLSSPVIREKIGSVLNLASLPLVKDGTMEATLYHSWSTSRDASVNHSVAPLDFCSIEHIRERERQLYSSSDPENDPLQKLINLVESAIPSIKPTRMLKEGQNTVSEADLVESNDNQVGVKRPTTPSNDNFGNNFRSPLSPVMRIPNYLLAASRHPISSFSIHLDSFARHFNSSLFGTSPTTSTSHLPSGSHSSNVQSSGPSSLIESCQYCIATSKYPQNHRRNDCPEIASMKPCKICHATGSQNHTLTKSPLLRIIRSVPLAWWFYNFVLEHCPFRRKTVLKLKNGKPADEKKDERDEKDDSDNKD